MFRIRACFLCFYFSSVVRVYSGGIRFVFCKYGQCPGIHLYLISNTVVHRLQLPVLIGATRRNAPQPSSKDRELFFLGQGVVLGDMVGFESVEAIILRLLEGSLSRDCALCVVKIFWVGRCCWFLSNGELSHSFLIHLCKARVADKRRCCSTGSNGVARCEHSCAMDIRFVAKCSTC